jgi:hypothetical protein
MKVHLVAFTMPGNENESEVRICTFENAAERPCQTGHVE